MVVNRAGRDRIERRNIATGDLLQASTEGYVDFDLRAGVLVARTVDRRIVELDAQSLDPIGAPFPDRVEVDGSMWLSDDAAGLAGDRRATCHHDADLRRGHPHAAR